MVGEAVPFGEIDAVNAARQNEIGGLPRMSLIAGLKERELIQRCPQTKPSSRPTLSSFLSSLMFTFALLSDGLVCLRSTQNTPLASREDPNYRVTVSSTLHSSFPIT
ncbi:hypothetical protein BLNAU_1386 [Blattamonas nauphoetae]|uniref:Uncharacterized protein n=1 Tax=Blattamonas nauphoetae TaxID=2049346 RepID=A0ABQ9YJ75_9EUKA|nr:hypothetical protein BLNAU_1386 [Blattamonas nauphoetae]